MYSQTVVSSSFLRAVKSACRVQNRYRTLVVIGAPCSGKTTLLKNFCQQTGWEYVNYTLTDGFFNAVTDIERYTPGDLMQRISMALEQFVSQDTDNQSRGLVIDEIEAVMATWTSNVQNMFLNQICSKTRLPCGLIIATRLITHRGLLKQFVKNDAQIFSLAGE